MHRFLCDAPVQLHQAVRLAPEEARHAAQVLRLKVGDRVTLLASGQAYLATLTAVGAEVTAVADEALKSPEPTLSVTLYQGVPKGDKMDAIVQKCTEAGITRIVPVNMPRCVAKLSPTDDKKRSRWQRIAREAAKQSFRATVPEIAPPVTLSALPALLPRHERVFVPWEEEHGCSLRQVVTPRLRDCALVIGPEGGMSDTDTAPLFSAGAQSVTLGPRIFRTETAGLAALIALMTLTENI